MQNLIDMSEKFRANSLSIGTINGLSISDNIPFSQVSQQFLSMTLDEFLRKKVGANESNYSEAITSIILAKSAVDLVTCISAFCEEMSNVLNKKSYTVIGGERAIYLPVVMGVIDDFLEPIISMAEDRVDQIASDMSMTDVSMFNDLCGG